MSDDRTPSLNAQPSRVSMLVWNTFLNDARVLNEARTLARAGYEVRVHALALPGVTPVFETLERGLSVQRCGGGQGRKQQGGGAGSFRGLALLLLLCSRVVAMLQMGWAVLAARPNLVHAHDVNMLPLAWLASRLLRVPLIYDAHEISTGREGYQAYRGLVAWLEQRIMPRAAGTITTTDARAKFFARAYRVPRPVVLQNRPRFQPALGTDLLRQELMLSEAWPIILYQGGLQPGRGLARLVEAAADVPNAYFVFIGGGQQAAELRALTDSLDLAERVRFIPTVPLAQLLCYTASADIGVQPIENTCLNHFTTDSNKLFEYVQAGLPVVASDLPEIRKVIRRHDLGLLVIPGDTASLVFALRSLVEDVALRKHHAEQSRVAAEQLSWEQQEHLLLELYQGLLGGFSVASGKRAASLAPKPRILLLSLYYPPDLSAGSFRSQALVNALAEQVNSHDLDVITAVPSRYSSWSPDIEESELPAGVRLRRIGLPTLPSNLLGQVLVMLIFMFRAYRVARGEQYAVVVATSSRLMTAVLGALIARRQKAALYLDIRDIFIENLSYLYGGRLWRPMIGLLGRLERWTIKQASRVNLVSKGFAGYFEVRYPERCFSYFSNGIDPLFMSGAEEAAVEVRDVSTRPLNILYAGNIGDGQGLHRIMPSLAERLGSRATFRVIGAGGRLQELSRALNERKIDSVELLPPVGREVLKQYYREADVLFLHLNDAPAFNRVLPSKLFEYAATGKPILAGVRGYAAEFIDQELGNVGVFSPLNAAEAEAQLGQLQLGLCDRSPFVERYARKTIMCDMATDIAELLTGTGEQ